MLTLCIIDDRDEQIVALQRILKESKLLSSCVNWGNSCEISLAIKDEQTGRECNYEEQLLRTISKIHECWGRNDLFLLDWSLLGENDQKDPISIRALRELFKQYPEHKRDILAKNKFIVIITRNGSGNEIDMDLDGNSDLSGILCVDKPTGVERLIELSSCPFKPGSISEEIFCDKHNSSTESSCSRNSCLESVIRKIASVLESKENG